MAKPKVKFKLNLKGLNQLMKGPEIQSVLDQKGQQIQATAESMSNGGEFETETKPLNWIAITTVRAKDRKAMKSVNEDNVLLKALGSGKG